MHPKLLPCSFQKERKHWQGHINVHLRAVTSLTQKVRILKRISEPTLVKSHTSVIGRTADGGLLDQMNLRGIIVSILA